MKALPYLIKKEFKQIFRNPFLPKLFIMLPTVMLLIMPWAANQEVKGLKLGVIDSDHSTTSERLVYKAAASKYFTLKDYSATYNDAMKSVNSGDADIILNIPQGFEKDLVTQGTAPVMILASAVDGQKSGLGSSYVAGIVQDYAADLREENGISPSPTGERMGGAFNVAPRYKYNPHLDYKVFMLPALMVMMLTMLSGFLPALNIVGEKEKGTMEAMNVSPVGKVEFILSKLIPYWAVGFFVLTYSMLLAWLVYGLVPLGSVATIYLFTTLYIIVVSGLGLVISNRSETMQQALFLMFFFLMVFILMSGLFTPVASMPQWAQTLTYANPLRWFIEVMRMVYLKGSGIANFTTHLIVLAVFALVMWGVAIITYKKSS